MARSLFNLLPGATPEHLALRQSELKRVITAVVASHPDVHYYQGLHDVAGVLVLVLGEHAAYVHLDRLVQHHLRDFTRYTHAPASHLFFRPLRVFGSTRRRRWLKCGPTGMERAC